MYCNYLEILPAGFFVGRGLCSVVRRCVHKASGQEYAVKIVDKLGDHGGADIGEITRNEAKILQTLSGHHNISEYISNKFFWWFTCTLTSCI